MRAGRPPRFLVIAAVAAAALLGAPTAAADTGGVTVELVPSSITIGAGHPRPVLLVVRNGGTATATGIHVDWLDPGVATVSPSPPQLKLDTLPAGAEHAWQLQVGLPAGAPATKVYFEVGYDVGGKPHIVTAALDVANATPTTADAAASIDLETTLETLDQQHSGTVYLLVTNKLPVQLSVTRVEGSGPDFVSFDKVAAVKIPPREQLAIAVGVHASNRVLPGKHLLLFTTSLKWNLGGAPESAQLVSTQQTQIGIAGESAVLTLLGVPSFLLIPGFLIVLAFATLWRLGVLRPAGASKDFPFKMTDPEFVVAAVTLSIAAAAVYPHLGGVDYLTGAYGLGDVVRIWIASLAVGVAGYVVFALWLGIRRRRRVPSESDSQTDTIRKLGRRGLGLELVSYTFGSGAAQHRGYRLVPADDPGPVWLAPAIIVTVNGGVQDGKVLLAKLTAKARAGSSRELAQLLQEREADLTITWEAGNGPRMPYVPTADDLKAATPEAPDRIAHIA